MILVRLALVTAREIPDRWHKTSMEIDGMRLNPLGYAEREKEQSLIVYGEAGLHHRPKLTGGHLVVVPKRERSCLEGALERYANVFAVSESMKRKISSPSPCVAFVPEDDGDKQLLGSACGILQEGNHAFPDTGRTLDYVTKADAIVGRLDGLALLAEALSQDHAGGRFRDLIRVFERAFSQTGERLRCSLSKFLDGTKFGYTEDEVRRWVRMRDRVSHADQGKQVLLEKDVAWLVHRVEQAAYDVLMNKKIWRNHNIERRSAWIPVTGTASPNGDMFITRGQPATLLYKTFDPFRCFPVDLSGFLKECPDTWWAGPFRRKDWRERQEPGAPMKKCDEPGA